MQKRGILHGGKSFFSLLTVPFFTMQFFVLPLFVLSAFLLTLAGCDSSESKRKSAAKKIGELTGNPVITLKDYAAFYNMKFGAAFFFVSDSQFFAGKKFTVTGEHLRDRTIPRWRATSVDIGQSLYPVFLYYQPAKDPSGKVNVTADLVILTQSGERFFSRPKIPVSWPEMPIPQREFILGSSSKAVLFSGYIPGTTRMLPEGRYTVRATVNDNVSGQKITIEQDLNVNVSG